MVNNGLIFEPNTSYANCSVFITLCRTIFSVYSDYLQLKSQSNVHIDFISNLNVSQSFYVRHLFIPHHIVGAYPYYSSWSKTVFSFGIGDILFCVLIQDTKDMCPASFVLF